MLLKANYLALPFVTCANLIATAYCIHLPQNLGDRVGRGYEGLLFQPLFFWDQAHLNWRESSGRSHFSSPYRHRVTKEGTNIVDSSMDSAQDGDDRAADDSGIRAPRSGGVR